jgi:hypothetical protein
MRITKLEESIKYKEIKNQELVSIIETKNINIIEEKAAHKAT